MYDLWPHLIFALCESLFFCIYVCVLHEFSAYTDKKEKKKSSRTQVMDEPPSRWLELSLGPLQNQPVLLTEPSLQALATLYNTLLF